MDQTGIERMKFQKLNDLEWQYGEYRIVKGEGLEGPVYEIHHQGQYLTEFSNFAIVKTYIDHDQMARGKAA